MSPLRGLVLTPSPWQGSRPTFQLGLGMLHVHGVGLAPNLLRRGWSGARQVVLDGSLAAGGNIFPHYPFFIF